MKVKGTCGVLLCSFLSLFYVMYKVHTISLFKHFTLIEVENGNISSFKVGIRTTSRKNKSNQITREININKDLLDDRLNEDKNDNRAIYEHVVSLPSRNDEERALFQKKTNDTSMQNITVVSNKTIVNDKIRIGILIPTSTRKLNNPILDNLSLTKTCLPSIFKTLETIYEYVIYIGIDKGDYLETVTERLEKFKKVRTVISSGGTFTKSVNTIARKAYQEGMDYLVRINDDSSFETYNWTSEGIRVLKKYSPVNIGVVGPTCHQGNTAILTHDMVHRTHLEIFDFYYPPYFDNWWADDWITKVYLPDRSTKLSNWIVKHHTGSHGTRYNVDFKKEASLVKVLVFDTERLNEYISNLEQKITDNDNLVTNYCLLDYDQIMGLYQTMIY